MPRRRVGEVYRYAISGLDAPSQRPLLPRPVTERQKGAQFGEGDKTTSALRCQVSFW